MLMHHLTCLRGLFHRRNSYAAPRIRVMRYARTRMRGADFIPANHQNPYISLFCGKTTAVTPIFYFKN